MLEMLKINMTSQCKLRSAVIPMAETEYGESSHFSKDCIKMTIWLVVSYMIIIF